MYLSAKVQAFDGLIEDAASSISILNERRTTLISAAVTGQIDVRDIVSKEASA